MPSTAIWEAYERGSVKAAGLINQLVRVLGRKRACEEGNYASRELDNERIGIHSPAAAG